MTKLVLLTLTFGMLVLARPVVNGLAIIPGSAVSTVQIADGDPPADPDDGGLIPPRPDISETA